MRILIAFDKFKESMSAQTACEVAASAVAQALPDARIETAPISDGGEGFCEILTLARNGRISEHSVSGPCGETRSAKLGMVGAAQIDNGTLKALGLNAIQGPLAIVEMAQASGLWGLAKELRKPWECSSFGTGQLIREAANMGAGAILLGIGGSATVDLGLGALEALGLHFVDKHGERIVGIRPRDWARVHAIEGTPLPLPPIIIACDVDNPLLGPRGAAAAFGPQKGLLPEEVTAMDSGLERMARLLLKHFGKPAETLNETSGGAAGGIGWGLRAAYGARYLPGFTLVWQWMGLEKGLAEADILITGEGRFDSGSLCGKGPGALAKTALEKGKRVFVFAGSVEDGIEDKLSNNERLRCVAISPKDMPLNEAISQGPELLRACICKEIVIFE